MMDFFSPTILIVFSGILLLMSASATIGTFTFLQKKSLLGDTLSHAIFPGICLAFIVVERKDPFILSIGAFIAAWIAISLLDFIKNKTKLKEDTAISIVLSSFFGIGILLMSYIQHHSNGNHTGLNNFLFGNAAALTQSDLIQFGIIAVIIIVTTILLFKEFKILSFDKEFAKSMGISIKTIEVIFNSLIILAIVTGIQTVGIILMTAILITPSAAARYWTNSCVKMTIISAFIGSISGVLGTSISLIFRGFSTGPLIVLSLAFIAIISFVFGTKKGFFHNWIKQHKLQKIIHNENALKAMYQIGETRNQFDGTYSLHEIIDRRYFPLQKLNSVLKSLEKEGFVSRKKSENWTLTDKGVLKGKHVVKLHRLWEMYLATHLNIASDHVHEDAETIEHIITPEIEAELERILEFPLNDPHNKEIPY